MSRFKKTMVFATLTALLLCLSWWLQADVSLADPAPFLRALGWLPGIGVLLLSVGICLRRGGSALFFDAVGGITLVLGFVLFVAYGGMENMTAPGTDIAINLVLCVWTALPLSFVVYTLVLGLNTRDDSRPRRRLAAALSACLAVWWLVLVICGQMLHFTYLKQKPEADKDVAWIGAEETRQ